MKPAPAISALVIRLFAGQGRDDGLRQFARVLARGLGEAHGDVAGEVAVLRIARALDHHLGAVGGFRQYGGYK